MDKQYFIQLLHKHLKGETTVEEDQLVVSYYNLFSSEPEVLALLHDEEKSRLGESMFTAIQQNIKRHEQHRGRVVTMRRWVYRSAAAAIVVGVLLTSFFYLHQKPALPGTADVVNNSRKQNRLIQLPDGSTVLLSYGSKLSYAPSFGQSGTRDVYLEGRAYFDIEHDPSRPFSVHTNDVKTTVLGTAFDVQTVNHDKQVIVTVTRGKVKVSNPARTLDVITPDQQLVYDRQKGKAEKKVVDAVSLLRWKDEADLFLDNVTFEEAVQVLKDRFNVTITFRDQELKKSRFTTVLLKDENLEQIIKSICAFHNAVCQYDKDSSSLVIRPGKAPL